MKSNEVAIIASIPEEIKIFEQFIKKHNFGDKTIRLAIGGVGRASAAIIAQKMICDQNPDIMLYTGFAGALDDHLKLGDIVVVSAAIDGEMDARTFNPRLKLGQFPFTKERVYKTDPRLVKTAMKCPTSRKFEGYATTTSAFMDAPAKQRFIKEVCPDLKAKLDGKMRTPNIVDMESSGFLAATTANNVPCLILRTISNTTRGHIMEDYLDSLFKRVERYFSVVKYILENID